MPKYQITGPDGNAFEVSAPDGATEAEVMAYAQKNFKMAATPAQPKDKPFGEQLNDSISDIPRQAGLTGRYAIEGVGGTLNFLATPFRAGLNAITPSVKPTVEDLIKGAKPRDRFQPMDFPGMANSMGLPQPRNSLERVVGDASRMVAGGTIPMGVGAQLAKNSSGVTQGVGAMMASNPVQQLASATAAGAAGGYTRETGGNDTSQFVASLAAGVGAPFAMNAASRLGATAQALRPRPAPSPVQIDITINDAMRGNGLTLAQMSDDVANSIRSDVSKAMQIGDNLDADAIRRLADYRLVGATPNRAGLTLNAADITQQRNLAKLGVNSKDEAAQQLGLMQQSNNQQMTRGLNGLGAGTADDAVAGGGKIIGALGQRNARAQSLITEKYNAARATDGRSALLDHEGFILNANKLLDDAMVGGKLPADVRNVLTKDWQKVVKNPGADPRAPKPEFGLPVDTAEQIKTNIAALQRGTIDMAEKKALGLVRQALDETPLLGNQQLGRESIDAFNKARSLNRKWMTIVDKTPALQAVRDGIEPDKFVQQYIVGGGGKSNVMDVAMLKSSIKSSPEAMDAVKTQITAHLKGKALNGNADEVGNFSQSAYNKALNAIGDRKMRMFFTPQEITQMKAIGRVASYEQFQPVGSAVNNSNTASALGGMLERFAGSSLLSKIPMGKQLIQDPLESIAVGMQAKHTLSVPKALTDGTRNPIPRIPRGMAMSPAMLMGTESEEDRKRREAGLLFP